MPRPFRRSPRDEGLLNDNPQHAPATTSLHQKAIASFVSWLTANGLSTDLLALAAAPALLDYVVYAYGKYLFRRGFPIHHLRYLLTGLKAGEPNLKGQLSHSWNVLAQWQALDPTEHRTPLPLAIPRAAVAIALAWGWLDWAGITLLSFWAPGRIGEPLLAVRADLVVPTDTLLQDTKRVLLKITLPKSRGRGPRTQHASVSKALEAAFISWCFGALPLHDHLWPQSQHTYRRAWNAILVDCLGIAPGTFTPGCLRGGGAISYYLSGLPIFDLQWQMRLANMETLRYYLQETAASNVLRELSDASRSNISIASKFYEALILAKMSSA